MYLSLNSLAVVRATPGFSTVWALVYRCPGRMASGQGANPLLLLLTVLQAVQNLRLRVLICARPSLFVQSQIKEKQWEQRKRGSNGENRGEKEEKGGQSEK